VITSAVMKPYYAAFNRLTAPLTGGAVPCRKAHASQHWFSELLLFAGGDIPL